MVGGLKKNRFGALGGSFKQQITQSTNQALGDVFRVSEDQVLPAAAAALSKVESQVEGMPGQEGAR